LQLQEVNTKISEVKQKRFRTNSLITDTGRKLESLRRDLELKKDQIERTLQERRRESWTTHKNAVRLPLENAVNNKSRELEDLQFQYLSEKAAINREDTLNSLFSNSLGKLADFDSIGNLVREKIGSNLFDAYSKSLDVSEKLTKAELAKVVSSLEKSLDSVKSKTELGKFSEVLSNYSNKALTIALTPTGEGTLDKTKAFAVAGLSAVTALVTAPVYTTFLVYKAFSDVKEGMKYSDIIKDSLVVESNLERIKSSLVQKADSLVEGQVKALEDKYPSMIEKSKQEILEAESLLRNFEQTAEASFKFDEDGLRSTLMINLESMTKEIQQLEDSLGEHKQLYDSLAFSLEDLNSSREDALENLKKEYLDMDRVGSSFEFDGKILLDVKSDKSLLFYELDHSSLMLYDDFEAVSKFIRLCSAQILTRLAATSYSIVVWDIEKMASYFSQLLDPKNQIGVCESHITFEGIEGSLEITHKSLLRKQKAITARYEDIVTYNRKMLEEDSVPEMYTFLFIVNPKESILNSDDFLQICSEGSKMGIYTTIFCEDNFLNKSYKNVVRRIDKIHKLYESSTSSFARDMMWERLEQLGS
jgi:hypothetical protein